MKAQELYLCFHTAHPASAPIPKPRLCFHWTVYTTGVCNKSITYAQRSWSTYFHSPSVPWWLGKAAEKHILIYWQSKEQFKMLSSYGTFPVPRFEGIPAFCPFFQMTLKIPDPEFCVILAYFTNSLSSFNDSIIYAFNSCTLNLFCRSLALGAFMMSLNS